MLTYHGKSNSHWKLPYVSKPEFKVAYAAFSITAGWNTSVVRISSNLKQSDSDMLCGQRMRTSFRVCSPISFAIENNRYLQMISDFEVRTFTLFFISSPLNNSFDMFSFHLRRMSKKSFMQSRPRDDTDTAE